MRNSRNFFAAFVLGASLSLFASEDIAVYELKNGNKISVKELNTVLSGYKYILLGEKHNNPNHHRIRGEIISAFTDSSPVVVSEHLDVGHMATWKDSVESSLDGCGFDKKGWKWPMHEPLFAALYNAKVELIGGNISKAEARDIAINGEQKIPNRLLELYKATPYSDSALKILSQDLINGHCGKLEATKIPKLSAAQHAKDASMATAMTSAKNKKIFLVAGNGHVRKDYGVPRIITFLDSAQKAVVIGFGTNGEYDNSKIENYRSMYDYIVLTQGVEEPDYCKQFENIKR